MSAVIDPIVRFPALQELCKPGSQPRLSTVERWARKAGIRYQYDASGGIWTTLSALDAALGISSAVSANEAYPADLI